MLWEILREHVFGASSCIVFNVMEGRPREDSVKSLSLPNIVIEHNVQDCKAVKYKIKKR